MEKIRAKPSLRSPGEKGLVEWVTREATPAILALVDRVNRMIDGELGAAGGYYETTFTNADLTAGVLTVSHSLNTNVPSVTIVDNTDAILTPSQVATTRIDADTITVDLSLFTVTGTWRVGVR